jgi:hypothetical protein
MKTFATSFVVVVGLSAAAAAGAEEGFFRPSPDPALTTFPTVPAPQPSRDAVQPPSVPDPAVLESQLRAREVAERELDRAQREQARAAAEAVRQPQPAPMIVSPLDGTAPIVSPIGR